VYVAIAVLLLETAHEFNVSEDLVAELGRLGVTNVALVRDEQTLAIVLEGWLFDPAHSAEAAAEVVGAAHRARPLRPVMQLAVSGAGKEG
jgi:hypothetical protein